MGMCWALVLARFWQDRRGQDMIEYALVAGMITLSAGFVAPSYIVVPIKALMSVVVSAVGVPNPT
jgi:Flp pilus assembly pilin Flp